MPCLLRCTVLALLALTAVLSLPFEAQANDKKKQNPVLVPIEDDPDLPRVLILGDSISMGYTLDARAMLKGTANLHRAPVNCGDTKRGLDQIDQWLGEGEWDVIHFNFGLHDLKYVDDKGQKVPVQEGSQNISVEQYAENLDALIKRLRQTDAVLIWRNTTPVPEGASGRVAGDAVRYNNAAAEVMAEHKVQVHDLYSFAKEHEKEIQIPGDVHYSKAGSKKLAQQVVKVIKAAL